MFITGSSISRLLLVGICLCNDATQWPMWPIKIPFNIYDLIGEAYIYIFIYNIRHINCVVTLCCLRIWGCLKIKFPKEVSFCCPLNDTRYFQIYKLSAYYCVSLYQIKLFNLKICLKLKLEYIKNCLSQTPSSSGLKLDLIVYQL